MKEAGTAWLEGRHGLSAEEARFIEIKLVLSRSLRERRESLKLTQIELAQRLRSSQSRIAKMEAGEPSVESNFASEIPGMNDSQQRVCVCPQPQNDGSYRKRTM